MEGKKSIYKNDKPLEYPNGYLQKFPDMDRPDCWKESGSNGCPKCNAYRKELKKCKEIRCSPDFKGEEGKEYAEGVDYKIDYEDTELVEDGAGGFVYDYRNIVLPLTQGEDEDELWDEAWMKIILKNQTAEWFTKTKPELKSKYTLIKKA